MNGSADPGERSKPHHSNTYILSQASPLRVSGHSAPEQAIRSNLAILTFSFEWKACLHFQSDVVLHSSFPTLVNGNPSGLHFRWLPGNDLRR